MCDAFAALPPIPIKKNSTIIFFLIFEIDTASFSISSLFIDLEIFKVFSKSTR